eukprot:2735162-Pleurochrysis_carterae.AAC.2
MTARREPSNQHSALLLAQRRRRSGRARSRVCTPFLCACRTPSPSATPPCPDSSSRRLCRRASAVALVQTDSSYSSLVRDRPSVSLLSPALGWLTRLCFPITPSLPMPI